MVQAEQYIQYWKTSVEQNDLKSRHWHNSSSELYPDHVWGKGHGQNFTSHKLKNVPFLLQMHIMSLCISSTYGTTSHV